MKVLLWNDELATVAQAWASQCLYEHDGVNKRKICSRDYDVGQNLYYLWDKNSVSNWAVAIEKWYEEVVKAASTSVSRFQGDQPDTAHYTQMIWGETREVGCGAVYYTPFMGGVSRMYVCNYGPLGNIVGAPMYQKGPAATSCSSASPSIKYRKLCD
ncbi:venom allergen 5.02-like [Homarus americanus]|uniref:CRISP/Allergen/PR-1-like 1 n=1 Tax=Homarus americanus TaxID=6706 RepID=A0A8J5JPU6_HOMAM|nr:venom allergen 5.02-like [Homarus americanus]KAG7161835.1 CRISP/Allergen/PR-1-like 1 [Homarus americanus]